LLLRDHGNLMSAVMLAIDFEQLLSLGGGLVARVLGANDNDLGVALDLRLDLASCVRHEASGFGAWYASRPVSATTFPSRVSGLRWLNSSAREGPNARSISSKLAQRLRRSPMALAGVRLETIGEWRAQASAGRNQRLAFLCSQLGFRNGADDALRYQLVHRAASALIEAKRIGASAAAMVVLSFEEDARSKADYQTFATCCGGDRTHASRVAKPGCN
jgi:hypothetical protein